MFVEATVDDKLIKAFKEVEETHKISEDYIIKLVSKPGVKLSNLVHKKDPFLSTCKDEKCVASKKTTENGKVLNCKKMNIVYEAKCKDCEIKGKKKVYYGESSRNLHLRHKEHYKNCDKGDITNSWMKKHIDKEHGSVKSEFVWNVIGTFQKPITRQLTEAVYIKNTKSSELLNLKSEYFNNNTKYSKETMCSECGRKFARDQELSHHFKTIHERMDCTMCDYKSFGELDMKLHLKTKH